MKLVVAFVQHANTLLTDLRRDRGRFWGARLSVADALLNRARDRVMHAVQVKLAAARVNFRQYRQPLVLEAVRQTAAGQPLSDDQAFAKCPVCSSLGIATGFRDATAGIWRDPSSKTIDPGINVEFTAESFACPVCGLRLSSSAEIEAGGMQQSWVEDPDRITELPAP
jgi:hypothetical protein